MKHYSITLPPLPAYHYALNCPYIDGKINAYDFFVVFKADAHFVDLHKNLDDEMCDEMHEYVTKVQRNIIDLINDRFDIDYPSEYVYGFDPLEFSEQKDRSPYLCIRFCIYSSLADNKIRSELESAFRSSGYDAAVYFQIQE